VRLVDSAFEVLRNFGDPRSHHERVSRLFDGQDMLYSKWRIEAVTQHWEDRDDEVESKERQEGKAALQED
jgi:hypothetical protein